MHTKKRFVLAPLFTAVLLMSWICMFSFAADSQVISVSLSAQSAAAGETFTATVSADKLSAVKSIMISPRYDSDKLELVSSRWIADNAFISSAETPAIATFEKNSVIDGEFFSCTFRVKNGVTGNAEISFDMSARTKPDGSPEISMPVPDVKSAFLSIGEKGSENGNDRVLGDVTGDKLVNSKDLTRLMKYLSGAPTEIYGGKANADINTDGKVNSKDLTRLMKMIAEE